VFQLTDNNLELMLLDRLACALHLHNFRATPNAIGWLFLNINLDVFINSMHDGSFFTQLFERTHFPAQRVVLEVIEGTDADGDAELQAAVDYCRALGCLVAIDDFGRRNANFDRVWRLRPDVVKFDRFLIARAARDSDTRRVMANLTSLLHDTGALVLMAGVETQDEALVALEAGVDLVQGFDFAHPAADIPPPDAQLAQFDALWRHARLLPARCLGRPVVDLAALRPKFLAASAAIAAGEALANAARFLFDCSSFARAKLLDGAGSVLEELVGTAPTDRFAPLQFAPGGFYGGRDYVRGALAQLGEPYLGKPHRSVHERTPVSTVALAFNMAGDSDLRILAADFVPRET
jgi:EAL domain-containing protein (putative c-di-GMP-specific phosphodiesterase class I)